MVIELVLTISPNAEPEPPEDDEPEPPRLPADELPVPPPLPLPPDDELAAAALDVEPPETVSPGEALDSDTIVPLVGANSLVLSSAICALCTAACALSTDACADAMLAGEGVVVVVVVLAALAVALLPEPPLAWPPDPLAPWLAMPLLA
jgi:hypothetical protein